MRHNESKLQIACVKWFRLQYPYLSKLLFAVPNGGYRNGHEAVIMKSEGVTAGVSDLILLVPCNGYSSLCVEFKTEKGVQSDSQKEWQKEAQKVGNKYVIVRTFGTFVKEIKNYLQKK